MNEYHWQSMKSIAELEAEAPERIARTRILAVSFVAVFILGIIVGRLSDKSAVEPTPSTQSRASQSTTVTAQPSLPSPLNSTVVAAASKKPGGKISAKDVEKMAEGAMLLDRFADSAKLMNVLREDYPKSHELKTLCNIRHLLHPQSGNESFSESDARELRSVWDAMKTIRRSFPTPA
jgi:hypothetical protein